MTDLTGKHALVTGGGTGIGAAIALQLANAGAAVTITGRRKSVLEAHSKNHGLIGFACGDVTDQQSVKEMFVSANKQNGPVDIVIANAGVAQSAAFEKTGVALWDKMISTNLTGCFLTISEGLKQMPKQKPGRIIAIASTAGIKGYGYVSAYCAAKHGVIGLTRSLAMELANDNITVNAICPGFTETPLLQDSLENISQKTGLSNEKARKILNQSNPQGKFIQPDEVAAAVLWLVGQGSDAITGQAISVSGGETW